MTLQEKIIELLPKEKDTRLKPIIGNSVLGVSCISCGLQEDCACHEYNKALEDVKGKLPEILKLIRERIAGLPPYFHQDIKE